MKKGIRVLLWVLALLALAMCVLAGVSRLGYHRGSLTVEERRNLPLALVGLIFLHFYPCYCVDTICPNIV